MGDLISDFLETIFETLEEEDGRGRRRENTDGTIIF